MQNISVDELVELFGANIIDIRNEQSYNNNHIPNAINIPFEKLTINPDNYLDRNKKYFIYCQRGIMSQKACNILRYKGFNVVNVNGGYEEWILKKS